MRILQSPWRTQHRKIQLSRSGVLAYAAVVPGNSSTLCNTNTPNLAASTWPNLQIYQEMIDRGWRRSGKFCYKPDLKRSCCPQYTIKLGALEFKPSKSQRKLVNRWNRFVIHGEQKDEDVPIDSPQGASNNGPKPKGKARAEHAFNLTDDIHASEASFVKDHTPAHRFEIILEPSAYSPEKFALFCSYQQQIHKDKDKSKSGFTGFLVQSPLAPQPIEYPDGRPPHLPATYGSYHQLYRLDGELIAMGVIDILPHCVSSVYFMYEKKWEKFSFGKLSALREIALAKEIHDAGVPGMQYVYLGFYIHSCQKMRYKGDYSPSYLADPEEYTWHPLEQWRPLLDKNHYASFAHPEHSLVKPAPSADPVPHVAEEVLESVQYVASFKRNTIEVAPLMSSNEWTRDDARSTILITIAALGDNVAQEAVLDFSYDLF